MSDTFWVQLFGFLSAFIAAAVGLATAYFTWSIRKEGRRQHEVIDEKLDKNTEMTAEVKAVVAPGELWKLGDPDRRG